jgi:tRNA/tmRNA/rRNA uracil-C5-methylase (TrmA/RlmC/RlmD family)
MPEHRISPPRPGAVVPLSVERVATGGRMIARLDGAVVLVAGAIPGETVLARVERVQRQTVWARTTEVVTASPDRVDCPPELACGGHVLAHVAEARQRVLKGEMLADALRRIGKIDLGTEPPVLGAAADGYRTRARIHVRHGRAGFFDEGSHRLCDVRASRQLTAASCDVLDALVRVLITSAPDLDAEIEWVEDAAGRRRRRSLGRAPCRRRADCAGPRRTSRRAASGTGFLPGQPLPAPAAAR